MQCWGVHKERGAPGTGSPCGGLVMSGLVAAPMKSCKYRPAVAGSTSKS